MPRGSASAARASRARSPEEALQRAETRARERLLGEALRVGDDVQAALAPGGWVRRHPVLAIASAAAVSAVAVPLALAVTRSPRRALRTARRLLGSAGGPSGEGSTLDRLRGMFLG